MKKCPFCKADIEDKARFCLYCMKPLNEKEVIPPRQKKKKWWLLAFVAALLLVLLVAFLLIQRGQANLPPKTTTAESAFTIENTDEITQGTQDTGDTLLDDFNTENTLQASGNQMQVQKPNNVTPTPSESTKPVTTPTATTKTEASTKNTKPTTAPTATTKTEASTKNTKPTTAPTATTKPEASTKNTKPTTAPTATTKPETPTQNTKPTTAPAATTKPETPTQNTTATIVPKETTGETTKPTASQIEAAYTYRAAREGDDFNANYTNSGNDIVITGIAQQSTNGTYDIPSYIDGKKVIAINTNAFSGSNAKIVYVPATVKTIWDYAFVGCGLTDIYFRGNAIYVENNAFSGSPVIHCSASCSDRNFRYYKDSAANYGATWKEWNG